MGEFLLGTAMFVTAVFLILLVLVQRGRGGGLAGALGGAGGQSAFGAKAGDVFTRITIGAATFWIILCVLAVILVGDSSKDQLNVGNKTTGSTGVKTNLDPDAEAPASGSSESTPAESATPKSPADSSESSSKPSE